MESVDRYMLVVKKNQSTILTTLFYYKGNKRKYDTFCYPMFLFSMNIINQCQNKFIMHKTDITKPTSQNQQFPSLDDPKDTSRVQQL